MQNKDNKVGNKTTKKEGKKEKKRAREKNRNRFARKNNTKQIQILAFAHASKQKKPFNYVRLVGKYAFFLAKLAFSHCYAN